MIFRKTGVHPRVTSAGRHFPDHAYKIRLEHSCYQKNDVDPADRPPAVQKAGRVCGRRSARLSPAVRRVHTPFSLYDPFLQRSHFSDAPWCCFGQISRGKGHPLQAVLLDPKYETSVKPQMKKYRCLWCVSTTNHNILYLIIISRTSRLNPANCLWKVANCLVWRGFFHGIAQKPVKIGPLHGFRSRFPGYVGCCSRTRHRTGAVSVVFLCRCGH